MLRIDCKRELCLAVAFALLAVGAAQANDMAVLWNGAGANDQAMWNQLGADGAVIAQDSPATSAGANHITIHFNGGTSGLVAYQCPAAPSCSWTGGFNAGDALLWTNNGTNGTAPLALSLSNSVLAAGLLLQADAPGQFAGKFQVEFSDKTTSPFFMLNSDANGDPLFVGLQDTSGPNIIAITFDVINSASDHDFAVDTLQLQTRQVTPEPASILLIGTGLLGLSRKLR